MIQSISTKEIERYLIHLKEQERSKETIEKYKRELYALLRFLSTMDVTKEALILWKSMLQETYSPSGVNGKLVAANGFFSFLGRYDLRMKLLKIQREIFSKEEKELTKQEYVRLVETAKKKGNTRLSLVLQTICATGIRVSELQYITVEAVRKGRAEVNCKGKHRIIFLPDKLQKILQRYAKKNKILKGVLFVTKKGNPLNRSNIWADMKNLCKEAQVSPEKVFPHNLRHLFARVFYSVQKDIAKLADILRHSSIETTRIYIMESGKEHRRKLNQMKLVL